MQQRAPTPVIDILISKKSTPEKIAAIEVLLQQGSPEVKSEAQPTDLLDEKDEAGLSTLHAACINGDRPLLEWIMRKRRDLLKAKTSRGTNVLSIAAREGNEDAVGYFLSLPEAEELVTAVNSHGETCLKYAGYNNNISIFERLQTLLKHDSFYKPGPDSKRASDALVATNIISLASNGHLDMLKYLHQKYKPIAMVADEEVWYPIHAAAQHGYTALVEFLVTEMGAAVNQLMKDPDRMSALQLASYNGHAVTCKALIRLGAAVDQLDMSGFNAMHNACRKGHLPVVECFFSPELHLSPTLLQSLITTPTANKKLTPPLSLAAEEGKLDVVRTLLGLGAPRDASDGNEQHAIHLAAAHDQADIVRFLINEKNVSPELRDKSSGTYTPLMMAAGNGALGVVKLLTGGLEQQEEKIDVPLDTQYKEGGNALTLAAVNGHKNVVRYLISVKKMNVNQSTTQGVALLTDAIQSSQWEIAQLLIELGAYVDLAFMDALQKLKKQVTDPGQRQAYDTLVQFVEKNFRIARDQHAEMMKFMTQQLTQVGQSSASKFVLGQQNSRQGKSSSAAQKSTKNPSGGDREIELKKNLKALQEQNAGLKKELKEAKKANQANKAAPSSAAASSTSSRSPAYGSTSSSSLTSSSASFWSSSASSSATNQATTTTIAPATKLPIKPKTSSLLERRYSYPFATPKNDIEMKKIESLQTKAAGIKKSG